MVLGSNMHCAAACDDNFAEHFCVMAYSLLKKNPEFQLHLIGLDLNERSLAMIRSLSDDHGFIITHHEASRNALSHLKTNHHLPTAAWCRLLLPSLLPDDVDRVLYLDCDLIVLENLKELETIDLNDKAVALVPDYASKAHWPEFLGLLELPLDGTYYNSGVMIMNLSYFRQHDLADKILGFAVENPEKLTLMDQCAINAVLRNDIFPLEKHYNFAPNVGLIEEEQPRIVHFMGLKPWQRNPPLASVLYLDIRSAISQIEKVEWLKAVDKKRVRQSWFKYLRRRVRFFYRPEKWLERRNDLKNYRYLKNSFLPKMLPTFESEK